MLSRFKPQRSSPELSEYVREMISKQVVVPFSGRGVQNHLFSVPKKGTTKRRVILDLSRLNLQIPCPSFKMVSVKEVRRCIPPNAWLTSIDLKDAYWHVPIAPQFRKFLAFALPEGTFAFQAMPFGLNIAPRTFTKLTAVLVAQLREMGIQCFAYLDDWLVVAESLAEATLHTEQVVRVLTNAGFIINREKSSLVPSQSIEWLGWTWDTRSLRLVFPAAKVKALVSRLDAFVSSATFTRRSLESVVGYLNWVVSVDMVGRISLKQVNCYQTRIGRKYQRDTRIPMSQELIQLLAYWRRLPTVELSQPQVFPPPSLTVVTDASKEGWGFHTSLG